MSAEVTEAREQLIRQVLRLLSSERDLPHVHSAAEAEYAKELIALAARNLAEATDALPENQRPVHWIRNHPTALDVGDWVTVTLRAARVVAPLSYDGSQPVLTLGHDAIPDVFPLALTDDTSVTFFATEAELRARARATSGGAA